MNDTIYILIIIIIRDLKMSNLLLTSTGLLKIGNKIKAKQNRQEKRT